MQSSLVGIESLPSRHHTGRSVPTCSDPALVIANENNAGELALRMLLVGATSGSEQSVQVRSKIPVRELFSTANLRLVNDSVSNVINPIVERLSHSFIGSDVCTCFRNS